MNTRQITGIVIHCAATRNGEWHTVYDIDQWHRARGFSRTDEFRRKMNPDLASIGYHFVIYPNGAIATGRHLDEVGAHAQGYNSKSIGVCLIGTDWFTLDQWDSLRGNIMSLQKLWPEARIVGHRDLPNVHKECPGFDVSAFLAGGMQPLPGHILEQAT